MTTASADQPVPSTKPAPAAAAPKKDGFATKIGRWTRRAPLQIFLMLVALAWLVPTLGLFFTSLLPADLISQEGWWKVVSDPSVATFANYRAVFDNEALVSSLWVTLQIAVGNTVLLVLVAALAGYAFAWLEFPGRDALFVVVIGLLVVPLQVALIPIFSIYNDAHLFDTVLGLILFHVAFGLPFGIFLMRNFFVGIPKDLLESARIDGASEITIFFKLMLPLALPAIASLAIFQFLWTWNDLIVALTFARDTKPITVEIFSQLRQFGTNIELIAPASFLSMIIPLVVFFAFQKSFANGLLAGSVK
ncbi:MAG: carbohydrate ABC transporter permease [Solirubrobacteraceae bacterium]|nr:carbohydrate ABC transporter permease [Solirubrobacteraceae bacterium]